MSESRRSYVTGGHLNAERFQDRSLHADFGAQFGSGALSLEDALGGLLRALGLANDTIPVALAERAGMFES